jgi:hypothetical protein
VANGRDEPELTDAALRSEIELLADLLTAVAHVTGPMSDAQIDEALGLSAPDATPFQADGPHPEDDAS